MSKSLDKFIIDSNKDLQQSLKKVNKYLKQALKAVAKVVPVQGECSFIDLRNPESKYVCGQEGPELFIDGEGLIKVNK